LKIKIDEKEVRGRPKEILLEVARRNHIHIPSLCYKQGFQGLGRCRLCIVEVKEGSRTRVVSSCVYPIKEGIEVFTNSEEILRLRKDIIKLLLLRTPNNPYIQELAQEYKVKAPQRYIRPREMEACILCGLCVIACEKLGTNAISLIHRGTTKRVATPYDDPAMDCIGCGACAEVCPTHAITMEEHDGKRIIWNKEFNLVKCSRCDKPYITLEALEYMYRDLPTEKDREHLCQACRRKDLAGKFKEAAQNISPN